VDKLTDEIVEDVISRVANCNELVQAVFLEQGLVTVLSLFFLWCVGMK